MQQSFDVTPSAVDQSRLSRHAEVRTRQRGLREDDIKLILQHGEPFAEGFGITRKALVRVRAELQRLERLLGVVVIKSQDTVVTVYRADKSRMKRLRRSK